jgi:hypothetical protein
MATVRVSLICLTRATQLSTGYVMKLMTTALAIAFALPTTFALAEGPMNLAEPVARPVVRGVTIMPSTAMPRNPSGNTLAPIRHDPTGSTLAPTATPVSARLVLSRSGRAIRQAERGPPVLTVPVQGDDLEAIRYAVNLVCRRPT